MTPENSNSLSDLLSNINSLADDESQASPIHSNVNMENLIIEHFTPYYNRDDANGIYLKGRLGKIKRDTIQKAINAFAYGISVEDVVLLIDKTFFKADEGMIITCNKIYYKNDDKKEQGVIDIMELDRVYAERKFWGNVFDLKDTSGRTYQLGQLAALEKPLYKLEDCMKKFIETIKKLRNG